MLIINTGGLIGDCISGIPITLTLSSFAIKQVPTYFANEQVATLLPKDANLRLIDSEELETLRGHNPTYELNNSKTFMRYHGIAHMTQAHYLINGLSDPGGPVRPRIEFDTDVPTYDYIVSPFSRSNSVDNNKFWDLSKWLEVFRHINRDGNKSICIVGSKDDIVIDTDIPLDYQYELPLRKVAGLINNARHGVLSVDNGISHLTYAVGAPHLLIYPQCLPLVWVCNPNARIVQGNPPDITVQSVISKL